MNLRIGLLELGDIKDEMRPNYKGLIAYVKRADELSYSNLWLGEHYDGNTLFSTPDALLPVLLEITHNIRIGSGGILLKYRSPYQVAVYFKVLAHLFPGRVDLGICKTILPYPFSTEVLGGELFRPDDKMWYRSKLEKLLCYLFEKQEPSYKNIPPENPASHPVIWILNSGFEETEEHKINHLHFCRSLFHGSTKLRDSEIKILAEEERGCAISISVYCSDNCKSSAKSGHDNLES